VDWPDRGYSCRYIPPRDVLSQGTPGQVKTAVNKAFDETEIIAGLSGQRRRNAPRCQ